MSTDRSSGEAAEDAYEATAVGETTPSLALGRPIPGRDRARSPFAAARSSSALAMGVAGIVLGTLLAAAATLLLVIAPANNEHARSLAEARLDLAAAQIEAIAEALQQAARRVAEAPATGAALSAGDADAIAALEARYAAAIDGALRVRINNSGRADIALTEVPPLTFSGLDLIRNAENGEVGGPEYLATEAGPLLNVTASIPGSGPRAMGTVMITFDAAMLSRPVAHLPADAGRFRVLQAFSGNTPVEVASQGAGGGGEPVQRRLSVANWALEFEPGVGSGVTSLLLAVPGWVLMLGVALAMLLIAQRRVLRAQRADLERLVDSANALALGRKPMAPRDYALDEFASAGAALAEIADNIEGSAQLKAQPAPKFKTRAPSEQLAAPAAPAEVQVEEIDDEEGVFLDLDDVDLDMGETDAEIVALDEDDPFAADAADAADTGIPIEDLPGETIFRDYDIRGIVGEQLSEDHARLIGRAIGSAVIDAGDGAMAVAGDCRSSTPMLKAALIEGITSAGVDVVDLGEVPTPILYHTTYTTDLRSGVIVTGSHNAPEYNGFKIVIGGTTLMSGSIADLRQRLVDGRLKSGSGSVNSADGVGRYIDEIAGDIALAQPLKVVVDCGNGVAGKVMLRLLDALGCEVLPLYCDPDGAFPNHHPDPADPANLEDLRTVVRAEGADIGIALDGDGDRIGAVDEKGNIIWPDRLMMLFSRDIVGRNPGADVIFDVKCSRHLNGLIAEYGGRPIMWKTGHAHLKNKMRETGALLGGELSGHISFGERWHGFDDGIYSAARLLEIIAGEAISVSEIFAGFPHAVATPEIRVLIDDARKFDVVERLIAAGALDQGDVTTIDGLRVDYPDGWGLVRASNTAPALTLRFEADTAGAVKEIADQFRSALRDVDASLDFDIDTSR